MKRLSPSVIISLVISLSLFCLVPNSKADTSGTVITTVKISVCGNGVLEGGEQCDNGALGSNSCSSLGYSRGNLRCTAACEFNATSCNTSAEETSTAVFLPSAGGSNILTEESTSLFIEIPRDFYSDTLLFNAFSYPSSDISDSRPAPSGLQFADVVYDLRFFDSSGNPVHTLSQPATIIISYDESILGNISESTIRPYKFDTESSSWLEIPGFTLDTSNNRVTFPSSSFSWFALFGSTPVNESHTSSESPSTSGGGRHLNPDWIGLILSGLKNIGNLNKIENANAIQKEEAQNPNPQSSESPSDQLEKPDKEREVGKDQGANKSNRSNKKSKDATTDQVNSQLKSLLQMLVMIGNILLKFIQLEDSAVNTANILFFLLNR